MPGRADSNEVQDTPAIGQSPWAGTTEDGSGAGEGGSPSLTLAGFSGPLDHLLTLARAHQIDLFDISLGALVAQLAAALRQAPATLPLGQKADWVVMAAWLVQLRSRLLLPADAPARQDAAAEADRFRGRLVALQDMQALAAWLERQPQLGCDVFTRGHPPSRAQSPEVFGVSVDAGQAVDVIEFLWASLALFDDQETPDTRALYRPRPIELYTVAEARERIRQRLAKTPDGAPLDRFLPDPPEAAENAALAKLRRRSAWSSTLVAGLELARQGEVVLEQGEDFEPIHISPTCGHSPP
jgi:segregation and condensation protein A